MGTEFTITSMNVPSKYDDELARFPAVLRELVEAEVAIGNVILAISQGFPAAPCGACIMLSRAVTTCPRQSMAGLVFYDRNSSSYSGEFTDAMTHYFVVEPPRPQEPPPDMDAIRAELEAREAAANRAGEAAASSAMRATAERAASQSASSQQERHDPTSVLSRFIASMEIDYDKWREGTGYDVTLLQQASAAEREAIEHHLRQRRIGDWRDIEALAAINSSGANEAIMDAFKSGGTAVRMAVHTYAPQLVTNSERIASLVRALEEGTFYDGLTDALREVEMFHPPEIMAALWRGLMAREGGIACHLAAMLYFLYGKSESAFDWNHRPFFLRLNTPVMADREVAVRELCVQLGVDLSGPNKP